MTTEEWQMTPKGGPRNGPGGVCLLSLAMQQAALRSQSVTSQEQGSLQVLR